MSRSIRIICAGILALTYISLLAASSPHRVHHLGEELKAHKSHIPDGPITSPALSANHVASGSTQHAHSDGTEADDSSHRNGPESSETCVLSAVSSQYPGLFYAAVVLAQIMQDVSFLASPSPHLPYFNFVDLRSPRGPPFLEWLV